jgi:hypothetical protein
MNRLLNFSDFIAEGLSLQYPSLKKVYLCTKRSSGQRWWSYKGFAGDKFFIQVTENNIDKININPDYPVLNYQSEIARQLLSEGRIKSENIYNHPDFIQLSGSKAEFHKLVGHSQYVPKTVLTKKKALSLSLPVIAKPASRHSGLGIQVFRTSEELEQADESAFDTYSEFVDKAEEHRFFCFKGIPFFWMQRLPSNDKAKSGEGNSEEQMEFKYVLRNHESIPAEYTKVLKKFCATFDKFPFICFDMMKGKDGRVFVIESNAQPGVPFDSTVKMYELIYEDFYGEPIDELSHKRLAEYSAAMIEKTQEKDPGRFSVSIK